MRLQEGHRAGTAQLAAVEKQWLVEVQAIQAREAERRAVLEAEVVGLREREAAWTSQQQQQHQQHQQQQQQPTGLEAALEMSLNEAEEAAERHREQLAALEEVCTSHSKCAVLPYVRVDENMPASGVGVH